jgi:hypothetical protein
MNITESPTWLEGIRAQWRIEVTKARRGLGTLLILVGTFFLASLVAGGFFLLVLALSPARNTETPADAVEAGMLAGLATTMIVGGLPLRGTPKTIDWK